MPGKMTADPKPTILLVPGAWMPSDSFNHTRDLLTQAGYESVAVDNPSVGNEPADQTLETDVASLRSTLHRLIDQEEKDVVAVLHSYGTFETAYAMTCPSLTKKSQAESLALVPAWDSVQSSAQARASKAESRLSSTSPPSYCRSGKLCSASLVARFLHGCGSR